MTRSNRVLNRALLALAGLVLVAAGGWMLAPRAVDALGLRLVLPGYPRPDATALWAAAAVFVVVAALAIGWAVTRGRGRTSRLIVAPGEGGTVTIDARVASDLLGEALGADPDVVSVGATTFVVRGGSVLSVRVTARRGADLKRIVDSVGAAVGPLDELLERRIPVLLHVASGVRATLAREQRAR